MERELLHQSGGLPVPEHSHFEDACTDEPGLRGDQSAVLCEADPRQQRREKRGGIHQGDSPEPPDSVGC